MPMRRMPTSHVHVDAYVHVQFLLLTTPHFSYLQATCDSRATYLQNPRGSNSMGFGTREMRS